MAVNEVKSAYRDTEGWVLFGADGEPVEWPADWPNEIDTAFLRERGIEVAA
jgi:hypothetical protein